MWIRFFMFFDVLLRRGSEITHGLDYDLAYTVYSGCLVGLCDRHLAQPPLQIDIINVI